MSFRVFKKYKSSSDQAYLLICFVSRYKKSILSSSDLKSLPYNHRAHPTQPITFLSQMKDMAKIRLFYSGTMALILPQLKDIANFVLKLTECSRSFQNVPDHTRIFQIIRECSRLFQNVPDYSRISKNILIILECSRSFQNVSNFLLPRYGIDFAPIKRYRQFCCQAYRMFKIIQECSKSFQNVPDHSRMSWNIQSQYLQANINPFSFLIHYCQLIILISKIKRKAFKFLY